jgi:hypothetical protein
MQDLLERERVTLAYSDARKDSASAYIVEFGITLQQLVNTRRAAMYLQENNISLSVALRVLSRSGNRRVQRRTESELQN